MTPPIVDPLEDMTGITEAIELSLSDEDYQLIRHCLTYALGDADKNETADIYRLLSDEFRPFD